MTRDRLAEGYVPSFDIDAEPGRQGELMVKSLVDSLKQGASIEVKTDERFAETGRLYVEYQCRRLGDWQPSGLATTHAELWVFVLGLDQAQAGVLVMETMRLRIACRSLYRVRDGVSFPYRKECVRGSHPTKGICAPLLLLLHEYRCAGETEAIAA